MGQLIPSTTAKVKSLTASGNTVLLERTDIFEMSGKSFGAEVAGVFEIDGHGRIKRWRYYYDMRSLEDRVAAELAPAT